MAREPSNMKQLSLNHVCKIGLKISVAIIQNSAIGSFPKNRVATDKNRQGPFRPAKIKPIP